MNLKKLILYLALSLQLYACADYQKVKTIIDKEKHYFSSTGFALVYENNLYAQKLVTRKLNNDNIVVMHSILKRGTPVKIINPENSKVVETKIHKKANYPKIFNVVISKKVASILELNIDNPYVEIIEVKKNRTFIAKESNTFEEEKNVADKAPVEKIKMNILTKDETENKEKLIKENSFLLIINDFYYLDSANNLKEELSKKIKSNNFKVKKINNTKYRLYAGPFKNFNALKTTYISLNDLGFENLNIYKE